MTSDKAYDEIRDEVDADYRDELRIQHIRLFEVSELEAAVSLDKQPYEYRIYRDEHPVTALVIGQYQLFNVVIVPNKGKSECKQSH